MRANTSCPFCRLACISVEEIWAQKKFERLTFLDEWQHYRWEPQVPENEPENGREEGQEIWDPNGIWGWGGITPTRGPRVQAWHSGPLETDYEYRLRLGRQLNSQRTFPLSKHRVRPVETW